MPSLCGCCLQDLCPQTVNKIGKREELMYNPIRPNDITWNFEKFLVDRQGKVRFRFHPTAWSHGDVVQPFIQQLVNERARAWTLWYAHRIPSDFVTSFLGSFRHFAVLHFRIVALKNCFLLFIFWFCEITEVEELCGSQWMKEQVGLATYPCKKLFLTKAPAYLACIFKTYFWRMRRIGGIRSGMKTSCP